MRILFIERSLKPDSRIFDQIIRIGCNAAVHVIAVQVRCPPFRHACVTSVGCPFFPKIESIKGALFVRCAKVAAARLISERQFDLIHAHFAYPDGLAAQAISKLARLPYVITGRGDDVLLYPQINRYLGKVVASVISGCDAFIGSSRHLCDRAVEFGAEPSRCAHISDGVIESVFTLPVERSESHDASTASSGDDAPSILFVGDFLPVKNVLRMIEAFAIVASECRGVTFELAGSGPLERSMRRLVQVHSLQDRCIFHGRLQHFDVAPLMQKATVLCLPSVSEGWPNVTVEAMACGTPVVGARVGGIPEQIISEEYGLICDPDNPADIADKLIRALRKWWNHTRIAEHGRMYTRDDTARRIVELYKKIIG